MQQRRFIQCDVFTSHPTQGNALAVVVGAAGMSDEQMQRFAAWTNLAETTFLVEPEDPTADYKVRIFTTVREMLFAGHPTLGSCAAWLHCGGVPKEKGVVRQECGVGIVPIEIDGRTPAFVAPPTKIEPMEDAQANELLSALHIAPNVVVNQALLNNGPQWQVFELASAADVLAVDSSLVRWPTYKSIGLIGAQTPEHECDYEVRMLAPSSGMSEDPITGSLNSALAHWFLSMKKLNKPLMIAQGTSINRSGRVYITPDTSDNIKVLIGGDTHILIDGTVTI